MKAYLQFFLAAVLIIPSLAFAQCGGTLLITVTPPPPHCNGDTVTITANLSGGNAGWSFKIYKDSITTASKISNTSNATDVPSVSTTYYSTADSSGCQQKLDSITIHAGPPQPVIIVQSDTLFCITDTSYTSYQWYLNGSLIPGATDTFFVMTGCYAYAVIVKDTNGCFALAQFILSCGVKSISADNTIISIFPNPLTSSSSLLQFNNHLTNAEVTISNILGNEILRKTISGNGMEIEKGRMENGIYFVKVRAEERQWVGKLVVQ
jgi:hypothetical protein